MGVLRRRGGASCGKGEQEEPSVTTVTGGFFLGCEQCSEHPGCDHGCSAGHRWAIGPGTVDLVALATGTRELKDPQRRCQPLGVGKGAGRSGEGNVDRIDIMSHPITMIYGFFVKRPFPISQRPSRPGMAGSELNRNGFTFHSPACQARRRPAIP